MTTATLAVLGPKRTAANIASKMTGIERVTSTSRIKSESSQPPK
jgi:hypothetical protein